MNGFKIIFFISVCYISVSSSFADIYEWTDENGVMHYSNTAPSAEARVLMKTKEEPYDEAADRARMEAERLERLELARLELAQREAELELREAESERRLREADRVAEEALREADFYKEEAQNNRTNDRSIGIGCYDYFYGCNYPVSERWYYRSTFIGRNYYKKPHYVSPYRRHRYEKYFRDSTKDYRHRFGRTARYRHKAHYTKYNLNTSGGRHWGGKRLAPRGGKFNGRGNISRGRSSFGRRH